MFNPLFTIALILSLFPLSIQAGTRFFKPDSDGFRVQSGFRYTRDTTSLLYVNYQVLRELAIDHLVDIPRVNLTFSCTATLTPVPVDEGKPLWQVVLTDPDVSGHTSFRGFDIREVLLPSAGSVELIHRSRADSGLSHCYPFSGIPFNGPVLRLPPVLIATFDPVTDTLVIRIHSLQFTRDDYTRLKNRLNLINDYYASSALLDSLTDRGSRIRLDSAGLLPYAFCDILDISKAVELILDRNFDGILMNGNRDPRNLQFKRQEALRMARSLMFTCMDRLGEEGRISLNGTIDTVARYYVDGLLRYVRLSSMMGDISGNLYQDLLDRYYELPAFPDDRLQLSRLARRIWPDAAPDTLVGFICRRVYYAYLARSKELIGRSMYAEATTLIRHARRFSLAAPGLAGLNGTEQLLSEAASGLYSSYLGIAASGIEYQKFGMAEVYIQKALDFKRSNEAYFATDTLYAHVFRKLFRQRLVNCDQLLDSGAFREAVECYTDFEHRFEPDLVALVSGWIGERRDSAWTGLFRVSRKDLERLEEEEQWDSVFTGLDQLEEIGSRLPGDRRVAGQLNAIRMRLLPMKYTVYAEKASLAVLSRDYRHAWDYFTVADDLAERTGSAHDSAFCADQREAFRHYQLEEIASMGRYIWNDEYDSANQYLAGVSDRLLRYDLQEDSALLAAVSAYRQRIFRRQCARVQEDAEVMLLRASLNAGSKRYVQAVSQFREVQSLKLNSPSCGFTLPGLEDTIRKYMFPAGYLLALDTLNTRYVLCDYPGVLQDLFRLPGMYAPADLARFGLEPVSAEAYIREKNNVSLSLEMVREQIRRQQVEAAAVYLDIAVEQGLDAKKSKELRKMIEKVSVATP